jgi:hypothetical protein
MIFDPDQVIEPGTCALLHCGTWRALPLSSIGHRIWPKSVGTTHSRCDLKLLAGAPRIFSGRRCDEFGSDKDAINTGA